MSSKSANANKVCLYTSRRGSGSGQRCGYHFGYYLSIVLLWSTSVVRTSRQQIVCLFVCFLATNFLAWFGGVVTVVAVALAVVVASVGSSVGFAWKAEIASASPSAPKQTLNVSSRGWRRALRDVRNFVCLFVSLSLSHSWLSRQQLEQMFGLCVAPPICWPPQDFARVSFSNKTKRNETKWIEMSLRRFARAD